MSLQNDLANYSFLSLLGSMILYWVSTLFGEELSSATPPFAPIPPFSPSRRERSEAKNAGQGFQKTEGFLKFPLSALRAKGEREKKAVAELPSVKLQAVLSKNQSSYQESKVFEDKQSLLKESTVESIKNNENSQKIEKEEGRLGKSYSPQNWFAIQNFARYGIIVSNILLGLLLILRWKESGHFPLSNLYESLMFLSWCFTGLYLFIDLGSDLRDASSTAELLQKNASPGLFDKPVSSSSAKKDKNDRFSRLSLSKNTRQLLGAITTPSALLTNAFATFTLPKEMQEATPLVPALQSNWLMMHVTVMVLSYAALILGSLLSIAFLIVTAFAGGEESEGTKQFASFPPFTTVGDEPPNCISSGNSSSETSSEAKKSEQNRKSKNRSFFDSNISPLAITLDNLSYRILGIGFPFLTIGILSGAVWANEAWGSYWSWDPKETWALLTWLIFAIYLHTRLSKGWEGKKPAIIASLGFVIVWICYLGVLFLFFA
jgi:cytochrome c-type biogenesis protein CcsB